MVSVNNQRRRKIPFTRHGPYSCRGTNILHKQNSLRLNDKKVDKLVDIADKLVEGSSRNGVVSTRAHLSGQTMIEDGLASDFSGDSHRQSHGRQFESPAEHIEVSSHEDEGDNRSVCDGGGALRGEVCQ